MNITNLIFTVLMAVESDHNPKAIGDGGKAVGILQMWEAPIIDVNRKYGTHYTVADRTNVQASAKICELYLKMYATSNRLGRTPTDEDRARIWNGGPNGYKKEATEEYWTKSLKFYKKEIK